MEPSPTYPLETDLIEDNLIVANTSLNETTTKDGSIPLEVRLPLTPTQIYMEQRAIFIAV